MPPVGLWAFPVLGLGTTAAGALKPRAHTWPGAGSLQVCGSSDTGQGRDQLLLGYSLPLPMLPKDFALS